jgi:hypothetical protein
MQTATLPVFAENYPSPAHNQSNQKALPLPIFDNGPLTAEKRIFSPPPFPQPTQKP